MLRLKAIFPDDWQYILDTYSKFVFSTGLKNIDENLLLMLLETGVLFGERLSRLPIKGFVEIGCGLALPSLTIAKLTQIGGKAIDIDPKVLTFAEDIRDHSKCALELECRDVFKDKPQLQKGELLIAEKPASYKKNVLEVEYTIRNWCAIENHDLAVIPIFMDSDTPELYAERCKMHEKKLKQVGFTVENKQVCEQMPLRWLIASKGPLF